MRTPSVLAALVLAATLAASPLRAEPAEEPEKPLSERLEEAIRGLVESVEPTLEQLRDTFAVFERIDSLEHYEDPEILPNGDILMRRKDDAPPFEPEEPAEPGAEPGGDPGTDPGVRT